MDSQDDQLKAALEILKQFPQAWVAEQVGISERRFRDIERGRSIPRAATRMAILRVAQEALAQVPISRDPEPLEARIDGAGTTSTLGALVVTGLMVLGFCLWGWLRPRMPPP